MEKIKILIICTGNSARSQIFEGLINTLFNDRFEAKSAGTQPSIVNPYAIKVMEEIDIDISHQRSKSIKEFYGNKFDLVITVCDNAKKVCPVFHGAGKMIHQAFSDPAAVKGNDKQILKAFRSVRDQICNWIKEVLTNQNN